MNILIACCLVVSDSEPEETNFKQHVCDKSNFIWWNQRKQNARRFETHESKGTAFRILSRDWKRDLSRIHSWIKQLL